MPVYQPDLPDDVQKRLGFLTQTRSGKRRDEEEVINRVDRKSQVRQCLGFCAADLQAKEAQKSAVQKP